MTPRKLYFLFLRAQSWSIASILGAKRRVSYWLARAKARQMHLLLSIAFVRALAHNNNHSFSRNITYFRSWSAVTCWFYQLPFLMDEQFNTTFLGEHKKGILSCWTLWRLIACTPSSERVAFQWKQSSQLDAMNLSVDTKLLLKFTYTKMILFLLKYMQIYH